MLKAKQPPRIMTPNAPRAAYALANRHHPKFKRAYRISIEDMKSPEVVSRLAVAIRNKSLIQVDAVIPAYNPRDPEAAARWADVVQTFEERYQQVLEESGKAEMARLRIPMSFNLQNPYSLPWIDRQAGRLIRDISEQTRLNIVGLIRSSFVDGLPPQQLARLIRAEIGLLPKEANAVERRFQNSLTQGVPAARAQDMVDRYSTKLLNDRAERIARTETITAEAQGQLDSWRVARDEGLIVSGTRRQWISGSADEGVCPICVSLHEVTVGMDEPWQTSRGPVMAPAAHPGCRCTVILLPPEE